MDGQLSPPIEVLLSDLDGVIRHFVPGFRAGIEPRYGLAEGSLMAAAFEPALLQRAITGRITRAEWTAEVGRRVGSGEAAEEWLAHRGHLDADVVAFVDEVRSRGLRVAVLTNGTDTVDDELAELELTEHLDAVFTTATIGHAKPDRRAFDYALAALDVDAERVFFTDDSEPNVVGAEAVGMTAHHFTGLDGLRRALEVALNP